MPVLCLLKHVLACVPCKKREKQKTEREKYVAPYLNC